MKNLVVWSGLYFPIRSRVGKTQLSRRTTIKSMKQATLKGSAYRVCLAETSIWLLSTNQRNGGVCKAKEKIGKQIYSFNFWNASRYWISHLDFTLHRRVKHEASNISRTSRSAYPFKVQLFWKVQNDLIKECYQISHDCNEYATCSLEGDGYDCSCNYGFEGNGWNCTGK